VDNSKVKRRPPNQAKTRQNRPCGSNTPGFRYGWYFIKTQPVGDDIMDLLKYKFEDPNNMCLSADKKLLEESVKRGFGAGNYTPYNKLFSQLFFRGGKLNFKNDIDEGFKGRALPYLKSFMSSFEPKHEEKEAICALLLSELVEAS